ncbi:MAG: hypothetical protein IKX46_02515 [Verrucomicrobia bacterium]|nr:hypothetical protein [Verrucomicrobiota bacterium]MBO4715803.1 hypothetical protein [Verrucomicrobiota bacterium]MBR5690809.1 hypothetical protein [Verrucomicrobiota bacterium]MBR5738194.1 hypothetical protein [Verrucomicrobiota bacterium]MBR5977841.1 hypothetical protein [Verrucomicrobiota bacterium]
MKKNLFNKNMILAALLVAAFAIAPAMAEAKNARNDKAAKPAPQAMAAQPENRGPGHGPQGPGHNGPRGPQPGFHHNPAPAPMPAPHHHVAPRPAPMPPRVMPAPAPIFAPAPVPPPPPPPPAAPAPIGYQWELNGGNWVLVRLGPIVIDLNW